MDSPTKFLLPERNPITHARHRKEVFWQITIPMAIGVLLFLLVATVVFLSATHEATNLSRWADVSLIWLILPSLFFALLFLVFLTGFIYLIIVFLKLAPNYARIIQQYFEIGKYKIFHFSNLVTRPFIKTRSTWAVVRHLGRIGKHRQDNP